VLKKTGKKFQAQKKFSSGSQGCQIFLGPNIPKCKKYTKWPQTIPKGHKLYQIALKYSKLLYNI
jgi:hypothetical protein